MKAPTSHLFNIIADRVLLALDEFNIAPYGDKLWLVPDWWRWVQAVLIFSFILMFGGLLTPNPSTPAGRKALRDPNVADGIFAITRHPVMWGAAIWAVTI